MPDQPTVNAAPHVGLDHADQPTWNEGTILSYDRRRGTGAVSRRLAKRSRLVS
jgi:hypothetical protein